MILKPDDIMVYNTWKNQVMRQKLFACHCRFTHNSYVGLFISTHFCFHPWKSCDHVFFLFSSLWFIFFFYFPSYKEENKVKKNKNKNIVFSSQILYFFSSNLTFPFLLFFSFWLEKTEHEQLFFLSGTFASLNHVDTLNSTWRLMCCCAQSWS